MKLSRRLCTMKSSPEINHVRVELVSSVSLSPSSGVYVTNVTPFLFDKYCARM
jgi:hypothetical protein